MSFNLVVGWKLQYQRKRISLLTGFSVSVQCSNYNSNNLRHNSFKKGVCLRKYLLSEFLPAIPQKMPGFYVMKDFLFLVKISKETKM